jgi:CAAX prenyl protease-like protein
VLACFWNRWRGALRWPVSWEAPALGALVFAAWAAAGSWPGQDPATPRIAAALAGLSAGGRLCWIAFRVAGSVLTVPLAEELAFRGYLARWLIDSDFEKVPFGRFTAFSLVVSSLAFGLLHQRWILGTFAGLLFAAATIRRGRLSDAVVAHATANALLSAFVLLTGNWGLWT